MVNKDWLEICCISTVMVRSSGGLVTPTKVMVYWVEKLEIVSELLAIESDGLLEEDT